MTVALPWTAPEVALGTDLERAAAQWIEPYNQQQHLMRTRDWLVHLSPGANVEMRVAAMTHDIERMFPGGPVLDLASRDWDDPFYLFAHGMRSAEIVADWMGELEPACVAADRKEVRRLVALHEVGGLRGADEIQAADSLSFLESLADVARDWVLSGACSREKAAAKLYYSVDRIRIPAAEEPAAQLLEWALDRLPAAAPAADRDRVAAP
jgi:hypothetical protein